MSSELNQTLDLIKTLSREDQIKVLHVLLKDKLLYQSSKLLETSTFQCRDCDCDIYIADFKTFFPSKIYFLDVFREERDIRVR